MPSLSLNATVAVVHMDAGRPSPFMARTSPKLPVRDSDVVLISAKSVGAKQVLVLTDEGNTWRVLAVQNGDATGVFSPEGFTITGNPRHVWVAATDTPSSFSMGQVLTCPEDSGCDLTQKLVDALPPMPRTPRRPKTETVPFDGRSARGIANTHTGEALIATRVDLTPR